MTALADHDAAAEASCVVSLIGLRAAMLAITLDTLEVMVDSESDDRGLLGIADDVPPGPLSGRVSVRLTAAGIDSATLEEIARWGVKHCPVCDALDDQFRSRPKSRPPDFRQPTVLNRSSNVPPVAALSVPRLEFGLLQEIGAVPVATA